MLFNIEADTGHEIIGYVVPDNFEKTPVLDIKEGGKTLLTLACNQQRYALVAAGRHATGLCGFSITEEMIGDLASRQTLEIVENETGLIIYRRRDPATVVEKRVLRLETHLFPLWDLDDAVGSKFQIFHKGIDRLGRESTTQAFHLDNMPSLYMSGRIAIRPYENLVSDRFHCILMMSDPFYELAERLSLLKNIGEIKTDILGPRDSVYFEPVINFAQDIQPENKSLRKSFDVMSKEVISILRNPISRQLSAESLDDPSPKGAVARSLSVLSTFALVGIRERDEEFIKDLCNSIELDPALVKRPPSFPKVEQLAAALRDIPEAEFLLEEDLEIFYVLRRAMENAVEL
jgi:hypothetical protein